MVETWSSDRVCRQRVEVRVLNACLVQKEDPNFLALSCGFHMMRLLARSLLPRPVDRQPSGYLDRLISTLTG